MGPSRVRGLARTAGRPSAPSPFSTAPEGSSTGSYEFTVRVHGDGFVVRVIVGDAGVLFTADAMDVEAFGDGVPGVGASLSEG